MRAMAMAMAIAKCKFDGDFFFNTAKLFRLGGILGKHFGNNSKGTLIPITE